ncbi:epoxide hydrolase family protein [Aspergillus brunneoviolaceus CBS 621.78]|uniref:Alpha/beta-hydrolase n=1 Tax=Aspergillus brunneoviolaceus CBS 621.78 TaxID=1450534 RepID=A0ACD1GPG4_9EURO|nr:alpha/beta-hydrolase [Aspergillus brunneoviolaceus CBS 621.78]RAH51141.1 alpha/beta-hydrolase [Aspergillus brunneoviolaceus CBS 621.78]
MRVLWAQVFALGSLLGTGQTSPVRSRNASQVQPFHVDLAARVPRMLEQIRSTKLPAQPVYVNTGNAHGITLDDLKSFQQEWLKDFDWKTEQKKINKFNQYTTTIEDLTIHFVHEKSNSSDAIPLLLLHGWPGSFLEFAPIIDELTAQATTATGKKVAFDVIVPSLPGFAFSSVPRVNWTIADTARVFNTLLTQVLHYETYAVFGTDWGAGIAYNLYDQYNSTVRAGHLAFLPFFPLTPEALAAQDITLSSLEAFEEAETMEWSNTGEGYFNEQTTKPNTIGLALQDNPVGQLAWIGEKFLNWSDPNAGTSPSVLTHNEILRHVSLYYLTETFASSVVIYAQNPNGFSTVYSKAHTDAPLLFSAFKYNVGFWPPALVAQTGNLVLYRNHKRGGHFPGLDNPVALVEDLREIGSYWK